MTLLCLPAELSDEIATHINTPDIFSLILVSRQVHDRFVHCINGRATDYRAHQHRRHDLTQGLESVTYWFDEGGTGSVLEWAIFNERVQIFERLVAISRMNLLQEDSWGTTLIHRLAGSTSQMSIRYMKALILQVRRVGKDPFQVDMSRLTPLHYAAGKGAHDAVKALIELGADVSASDNHGNTPLHLAAVAGSHWVLELLVKAGADVHAECMQGWCAIDQASIAQHKSTVKILEHLGSRLPTWEQRQRPVEEFMKLSPCPIGSQR